jgi:hypothetical protein
MASITGSVDIRQATPLEMSKVMVFEAANKPAISFNYHNNFGPNQQQVAAITTVTVTWTDLASLEVLLGFLKELQQPG